MDYQWKKLYRLFFLIFKKVKNKNKYIEIFIKSLSIDKKKFTEKLKYNDILEWDSISHMTLMSELEDGFNISIDTDDIIDFSSFKKGIQILKKYKIT